MISQNRNKNIDRIGEIKKDVRFTVKCPVCHENIKLGVEAEILEKIHKKGIFPYPHLHLHGQPLHAMLVYIDKQHHIRNTGAIHSMEISRDANTLQQIMRKWSNIT